MLKVNIPTKLFSLTTISPYSVNINPENPKIPNPGIKDSMNKSKNPVIIGGVVFRDQRAASGAGACVLSGPAAGGMPAAGPARWLWA